MEEDSDIDQSLGGSYQEEIVNLWNASFGISGISSRHTTRSVLVNLTQSVQEAQDRQLDKRTFRISMLLMMISGASVHFFAKSIYMIVGEDLAGRDSGLKGLENNKWLVAILILGYLLACALPPSLFQRNREAVRWAMNMGFSVQLIALSFLDLMSLSFYFVSLVFLPPTVVMLLQYSVQLVTLAFLGHARGRVLIRYQWVSLSICLFADVIVSYGDVISIDTDDNVIGSASQQISGIFIIGVAGVMGAFQSSIEESILQEHAIPDSALLMIENWVSAVMLILLMIPIGLVTDYDTLDDTVRQMLNEPAVLVCFVFFLCTAYGMQAGRFKVLKYSSAMVSTFISLIFPPLGWLISLIAYACTAHMQDTIGEKWVNPGAWFRLAGYVVLIMSVFSFIKHRKRRAPPRTIEAVTRLTSE